jgi:uncharacterized protein (DUF362 family)
MGEVYVIYGTKVEKMVRQLIEGTGALDRLHTAHTVMIKPNLVASRENWIGVNTDPRVIEAVVKCLKDQGVHRITVGDGSGMGYSATKAFGYCGYKDLSSRYGFRLVDLEKDEL